MMIIMFREVSFLSKDLYRGGLAAYVGRDKNGCFVTAKVLSTKVLKECIQIRWTILYLSNLKDNFPKQKVSNSIWGRPWSRFCVEFTQDKEGHWFNYGNNR